jgi:hypothetical protein
MTALTRPILAPTLTANGNEAGFFIANDTWLALPYVVERRITNGAHANMDISSVRDVGIAQKLRLLLLALRMGRVNIRRVADDGNGSQNVLKAARTPEHQGISRLLELGTA